MDPGNADTTHVLGVVFNALRLLIEAGAVVYSLAFLFAAVTYLYVHHRPEPSVIRNDGGAGAEQMRVAVIYLCCGDLEVDALRSLSRLHHRSCRSLLHIVHDDSADARQQHEVDLAVTRVERETGVRWRVLRRGNKTGGKAGVLNAVLEATGGEYDLFLLCDNDSYADDPDVIDKAIPLFNDGTVAIVQFRNMRHVSPGESGFTSHLANAIEVFDVFMTGLYRRLWTPFVGHNAVLRTRDVLEVGGFTPGFFADDIDLTVRLNLVAKRIIYRRDLRMSEGHPSNYRSFCLRAQKWASGCGQVIRAHLANVLASRAMSLREKLGFLLFCGFYGTQGLMLAYLLIVFLALPMLSEHAWEASARTLIVATLVPVSVFGAVAAYLLTEGRRRPFWATLLACAAAYGSTDFWTIRGLVRGFFGRAGRWVPTNSVHTGAPAALLWAHFVLGTLVLLIPAWKQPALLLAPMTWVFAGKYIFVPAVDRHYRPSPRGGPREPLAGRIVRNPWLTHATAGLMVLAAVVGFTTGTAAPARAPTPPTRVEVRAGRLLVDGERLVIKGIHYSPWRPGAGPRKGFEYPSRGDVASDLDLIRSLNANTILIYDAPEWVTDLAGQRGLNVIYAFHVPWWQVAEGKTADIGDDIGRRVAALRDDKAIIAWMVGHEAPAWVGDKLEADGLREAISTLRRAVKAADPVRPVCYGNWPLAITMDLDREMDILAYNVYPFFPMEVAAAGYGEYIRTRIMPLARDRPVIISEFGVNTIESSPQRQAEVLRECWEGILKSGAQGGVVFEFADEWWKNYDNPIRAPDWWRREDAPDDHLTDDEDPEEHYGLFDARRNPKPAAETVRAMFASVGRLQGMSMASFAGWWRWGAIAALLIVAAWLYARGARKARAGAEGGA